MVFKEKFKKVTALILVIISGLILSVDLIYKTIKDINYYSREKCILFLKLPKTGFLIYEYFFELFFIVIIGIFVAVLLENYFSRFKKFYPKNPILSFLYASLIPVCACTTLPLIKSMKDKISFTTLMTFIISAPLLSPYIILLSFSILGLRYGILRIISSFILAISSGFILNIFNKKNRSKINTSTIPTIKNKQACPIIKDDLLIKTFNILYSISPYIIIAAILGIIIELYLPIDFIEKYNFNNNPLEILLIVIIAIPIYLCHGADVLFLKPLINHSSLGLGTAMSFSLASTAICITSIVLLIKFMGKKLTVIYVLNIFVITVILGLLINIFF